MSLKDAVSEIADQIESDLRGIDNHPPVTVVLLSHIVRQLRSALKAADDSGWNMMPEASLDNARIAAMRQREAENAVRLKAKIEQDKGIGQAMIRCENGPCEGLYHDVNPSMPVGAKMRIEGNVYKLQGDGKLWHVPEKEKK